MRRFMRRFHKGEKGLTLIELLIVVAILGILAAVIVPNLGGFLITGRVAGANTEAANVKTAAVGFLAEKGVWPTHTGETDFSDFITGTLKATYSFDGVGLIDGGGNPGIADPAASATFTSTGWPDITFYSADQQWKRTP